MKILLVEDDVSTRQFLSTVLTNHRYTVDVATDGQTGWELASQKNYDAILLDVMASKMDGIQVCRQLRQQGCQTPILMLTAKDSDEDVVHGLDAGADDYVTKPCEPSRLVAQVRALLRRQGNATASSVLAWGELRFDPTLIQVTYQQQVITLSPKEYSLLELFLRHPQRIFSRSSIIDYLWSIDDAPSDAAVTNLVKDLRRKLKAAGMEEELIETVYRLGYRLRRPPLSLVTATSTAPNAPLDDQDHRDRLTQEGLDLMQQVVQNFGSSLHERLERVQQQLRSLQDHPSNAELWHHIKNEAHRLVGGLDTFGYAGGSDVARELEHLAHDPTQWTEVGVARAFQLLETLTHQLEPSAVLEVPASEGEALPLVLVIEDDLVLTEALRQTASGLGLQVMVVSETAAMMDLVMERFTPSVVLVGFHQAMQSIYGQTLLQYLKTWFPAVPVLTLAEHDRLGDRVMAARLGSDRYILKPATVDDVLEAIAQVLPQTSLPHARVMIVDDDPMVLQVLTGLLQPWHLHITALSDPDQFWQVLTTTQPDVLLLDLEMPTFNGVELCRVVRQDARYSDLPILVVTAHTEMEWIQQVFAAGADDFIVKPIAGPDLVTRVISRIERSRMQRQLLRFQRSQFQVWKQDAKTDFLTQVANRRYLDEFLEQDWHRPDPAPLALILCDVDYFKAYNDKQGHQAGDLCLQQVARAIRDCTNVGRDLVGRYGGDEFAIVLPSTNSNGALRVAERIQAAIAQLHLVHPVSPAHTEVTVTMGITATLPTPDKPPTALIAIADQALYAAKARGRNTYCLYPL